MTEPSGLLIVNKHSGVTSHDIVGKVRRLFGTRRVGHTGTLDPMASGVLVVLIGRAAKAAEYLVADEKKYKALLCLGLTTDTEDTTGTVLSTSERIPSSEEVLAACRGFLGEIEQIPPMYSALKVDGQKLCDLARKGVTVERKPRPVTIHSLTCTSTDRVDAYELEVHCSSGTYIRTLCADIGAALGCGGAMGALCRTETGGFSISHAKTVAELEQMTEEERLACLIPTERLFDSLPAIRLPEFFERLCRGGCEIYQKKLHSSLPVGQRVRLCNANGEFFALGEIRSYEQGTAVKSIKIFDLGE